MKKWDGWFWRFAMWNSWNGWGSPRVRVNDALGRACWIDVRNLGEFARTLPAERGRALFWSTLPPWFAITVFSIGVCGIVFPAALMVAAALLHISKPTGGWILICIAVIVPPYFLLSCMPFAVSRARRRHASTRCLPACAAAGVCPNCHYQLSGLAKVDGAVKCPECGFVWATL